MSFGEINTQSSYAWSTWVRKPEVLTAAVPRGADSTEEVDILQKRIAKDGTKGFRLRQGAVMRPTHPGFAYEHEADPVARWGCRLHSHGGSLLL